MATAFDALIWARRQTVGGAGRKAVLNMLAEYADKFTWECFPGVGQIAADTELDERSVRRALDRLEEDGFIARRRPRRPDGTLGRYVIRLNPRGEQVVTAAEPPIALETGPDGDEFTAEIEAVGGAESHRTKCPVDSAAAAGEAQDVVAAPADTAPGGPPTSGHCVRIQRTLCPVHRDELPLELPLPHDPQERDAADPPAQEAGGGVPSGETPLTENRGERLLAALGRRIGPAAFRSWFGAASARCDAGSASARIGVPSKFVAEMARQRYGAAAEAAAVEILGPAARVAFVVDEAATARLAAAARADATPRAASGTAGRPNRAAKRDRRADAATGPGFAAWTREIAVAWLAFGRWNAARFGRRPDDPAFAPPASARTAALALFAAATADGAGASPAGLDARAFETIRKAWTRLDGGGRAILKARERALRNPAAEEAA